MSMNKHETHQNPLLFCHARDQIHGFTRARQGPTTDP